MSTFKISLLAARKNAKYTQKEVADILKIKKETLSSWENGKTEPKITQATQLSELYNIPLDNLDFLPS